MKKIIREHKALLAKTARLRDTINPNQKYLYNGFLWKMYDVIQSYNGYTVYLKIDESVDEKYRGSTSVEVNNIFKIVRGHYKGRSYPKILSEGIAYDRKGNMWINVVIDNKLVRKPF